MFSHFPPPLKSIVTSQQGSKGATVKCNEAKYPLTCNAMCIRILYNTKILLQQCRVDIGTDGRQV